MNNRTTLSIYWRKGELFDRQQKILEAWNGSNRNKDLIRLFQGHLFAKGCKQVRVAKLTWILRNLCDIYNKDLDKIVKSDIDIIISKIEQHTRYQQSTKADYKKGLKQFYKWFEDEDLRLESKDDISRLEAIKLYKYLKKLSIKTIIKDHDPGSVVTEQEIKTILDKGCNSAMDKAFIILLHETGCRIGEFLNIRIKDIQQNDSVWIVNVNGKTGERPIPFIKSIPYILKWLDIHPSKDKEDYIWSSLNTRFRGQPLEYIGAKRLLDRCFLRAGITKPHNCHWMRHSRSTIDAPDYNEAILCKLRGWKLGSLQVRRYTHLSGKEVNDAFKKVNGILKHDEVRPILQQTCFCGRINEPESKYCSSCGKALSVGVFLEDQDKVKVETDKTIQFLMEVMKNPEMLKRFEEFKQRT